MSARGVTVCQTDRLTLVVGGPAMAAQVAEYYARNHEHFAPTSPRRAPGFYEEDTLRQSLRSGQEDFGAGRALPLLLLRRGELAGPVLGTATFSNVVRGPFLACYLGYALDRDQVGKGLMFEALTAAVHHVFAELRLHRIMANYMPTNQRSGRLLRRLGFTVEGYARDYLFLAGAWQDHVLTSLTNPAPLEPG